MHAVTNATFNEGIAILGGTGDQGLGLALRFAKADRPVVIGSRVLDRAETAEKAVAAAGLGWSFSGYPSSTQRRR